MMSNLVQPLFESTFKFDKSTAKMSNKASSSNTSVVRKISKGETIHSGHFMVSEIDENDNLAEKTEKQTVEEPDYERVEKSVDQMLANFKFPISRLSSHDHTCLYGAKTNNFVLIDENLSKLFQCMNLAYDGKITSPKWKAFKGLKLNIKDKIRLNNIIWRAWYIQYIAGRNPEVCQFSSPIDSSRHKRTETILLEGKYWKRKVNTVTTEYKKWRMFHQKARRLQTSAKHFSVDWENNLPRWSNNLSFDTLFSYDEDFSSCQTSNLNDVQNFNAFYNYTNTNSREIARSGMGADFMQPGLDQLQPNIDFMDTFEPIQDFITRAQLPTVLEESSNFESIIKDQQTQDDLLNSIFATNNSQPNNVMELPKQIASSNYPNMFETSADITQLNEGKISKNDLLLQQQSTALLENNFDQLGRLEIDYNYPNQIITGYNQNVDQPLTQNSQVSQLQPRTSKASNLLADNLYKMGYKVDADNSEIQMANTSSSTDCINYSMQRFQMSHPQSSTQSSSLNPMNAFQPNYSQEMNKNMGNKSKYNYTPYYLNNSHENIAKPYINTSNSLAEFASKSGPRVRSKSISNSDKCVTIKSLLNKPSLVSAMNQNELNFKSVDQNSMQVRSNSTGIERSLSLPISQENQRKAATIRGNSLFRQQVNQYDPSSSILPKSANYLFNSNVGNFQYQANPMGALNSSTSPISSNSSSYSNQDSHQCLPPIGDSSLQLLTNDSIEYPFDKVSDSQLNPTSSDSIPFINSNNQSSTLMSSVQARNVYGSNVNTSSSSSSPIGSLDQNLKKLYEYVPQNLNDKMTNESAYSTNNEINMSFLPFHKNLVSNSSHKHSLHSNIQSNQFGATLPKSVSTERKLYKERRRVCHINAEQKRRCNIKNGFDTLRNLLPSLSLNVNTKISKAAMLQKAADYIRILKNEKFEQQNEYDMLKQQVESLNQTIRVFQNQLPATGAPIMGHRSSKIKEQYQEYVRTMTLQNWKFWIFSIIMDSLLDSYCNTVATSNFEEMCKTVFRWLNQNCCLITLRRDVGCSLSYISTSTNILTNPELLPKEILDKVNRKQRKKDGKRE